MVGGVLTSRSMILKRLGGDLSGDVWFGLGEIRGSRREGMILFDVPLPQLIRYGCALDRHTKSFIHVSLQPCVNP